MNRKEFLLKGSVAALGALIAVPMLASSKPKPTTDEIRDAIERALGAFHWEHNTPENRKRALAAVESALDRLGIQHESLADTTNNDRDIEEAGCMIVDSYIDGVDGFDHVIIHRTIMMKRGVIKSGNFG